MSELVISGDVAITANVPVYQHTSDGRLVSDWSGVMMAPEVKEQLEHMKLILDSDPREADLATRAEWEHLRDCVNELLIPNFDNGLRPE